MKAKKRMRKENKQVKELNRYIHNMLEQTENFKSFLYMIEFNDFMDELQIESMDKVRVFRLCMIFQFTYIKEENVLKTMHKDEPNNPHLSELKSFIPADKLLFECEF